MRSRRAKQAPPTARAQQAREAGPPHGLRFMEGGGGVGGSGRETRGAWGEKDTDSLRLPPPLSSRFKKDAPSTCAFARIREEEGGEEVVSSPLLGGSRNDGAPADFLAMPSVLVLPLFALLLLPLLLPSTPLLHRPSRLPAERFKAWLCAGTELQARCSFTFFLRCGSIDHKGSILCQFIALVIFFSKHE